MQIPKRRSYISESFRHQWDVEAWALAVERKIDPGKTPTTRAGIDPTTLSRC